MASTQFLVAEPGLLPSPAARQAARDHLAAATTAHWSALTSERPRWAGPAPRCADCGRIVLYGFHTIATGWPCPACGRILPLGDPGHLTVRRSSVA